MNVNAGCNYVERDDEVQDAFLVATQRNFLDYTKVIAASDFTILDCPESQNPFDLVAPILRAGHKMAFMGEQCFEVKDGYGSYYFVGRKPAVIEKIRKLVDSGAE